MTGTNAPLVRRLQRLADRPGLVSRQPSRRLLERHDRITGGLPLSALITRHSGTVASRAGGDLPVVSATRAAPRPSDGAAPAAPVAITRAPASRPVIQRKAAASGLPSAAGPAAPGSLVARSVTALPVPPATDAAAPGSPVAPAVTARTPPPAAVAPAQLLPASPDPTPAAGHPPVVDLGRAVQPAAVHLAAVHLAAPPVASPADLEVHHPFRPGGPDPAAPPPLGSAAQPVVRATAGRPRDGHVQLPVVPASPPPTPPSGVAAPMPSEPVVVRATGVPRHAAAGIPPLPGAPAQLPVVGVTARQAMSPRLALPLADPIGAGASAGAAERGSPVALTGTVADRQASRPSGTGPGRPGLGTEAGAPPTSPTPLAMPVDVDAIAATVQRRVLRRFELEAERRGVRR